MMRKDRLMKRRILTIAFAVLCTLVLSSAASAECMEHNYFPLTDLQLRAVHRETLLCTQCGQINSSQVTCSQCDGSGAITCSRCNGEQIIWELCTYCYGTGRQSNGKKCLCELYEGKTGYTYDLCPDCGGLGFDFCAKTVERTRCQSCGAPARKLICSLCFDLYNVGECPYCAKDSYAKFDYRTVMRQPEENLNNPYCISGTISEIEGLAQVSSGTVYSITLKQKQMFNSTTYRVTYFAPKSADKLLAGDRVSMWGNFVHCTSNNEPQFNIYFATVQ